MSRIFLSNPQCSDVKIESLLETFQRKVRVYPPGTCPLTVQLSLLQASKNQTCGKCVPCREGLVQLEHMLNEILDGKATAQTLERMQTMATLIKDTADCAIGYQSAIEVLQGLEKFRDEYISHIEEHMCPGETGQKIPCVNLCPTHVDIPGYISLIEQEDYQAAVQLIRKENPLPTACAFVCEHPCEDRCRRNLIDDSINIRGLKKYAVDQSAANVVSVPKANVSTGKKVAVIGGGPSGLTAAYFLGQRGHEVTIFEEKEKLGGMLRYGIPNYRFPKDRLDEDVEAILASGSIEVRCNVRAGRDVPLETIHTEYDAMYVAVGAQEGKRFRIDGLDAGNVASAVEMLDQIGHGKIPDYTGQTVVVIGGGNVAMDAARSAVRCNARDICIVYRRRQDDMTALDTEIESTILEGIELITLQSPKAIETDEHGNCSALLTQPQMIGAYDSEGRPSPIDANKPLERIPCSVILIAVGQDIDSAPFERFGIKCDRRRLIAGLDTAVESLPGVFAGGDCVTGPATAIKAIAAGKVAAHNIDEYLGYHHKLMCRVQPAQPKENNRVPTGRANVSERPAYIRKHDFEHVENPFTYQEAMQEAGRCLRCDHFGCGVLEGGRDI